MSPKAAAAVVSLLVAVIAGIVVVARGSRTQHPPVAPSVPRIENLG